MGLAVFVEREIDNEVGAVNEQRVHRPGAGRGFRRIGHFKAHVFELLADFCLGHLVCHGVFQHGVGFARFACDRRYRQPHPYDED